MLSPLSLERVLEWYASIFRSSLEQFNYPRTMLGIAVCSCCIAVAALETGPNAVASAPKCPANELILLGGGLDPWQDEKASFCALQARFAPDYFGVRPYATVGWASDGSYYTGAGLFYCFALPHRLRLTVGSGPGYYRHEGRTTNLGYSLEFNSWIELSGIVHRHWIGLSFAHISNAHLGNVNPGSETLGLSVSALSW